MFTYTYIHEDYFCIQLVSTYTVGVCSYARMLPREGEFWYARGWGGCRSFDSISTLGAQLVSKGYYARIDRASVQKGREGENYVLIFSYVHIYSGKVIEMK